MNKILLILALIIISLFAKAEDTNIILRVELKDGTMNEYVIAERPEIKFEGAMTIFTCKGISTEYIQSTIERFSFVSEGTGIKELQTGDTRTYYFGDKLFVEDSIDANQILIYSIDGKMRQASIDKQGQTIEISFTGFPTGYYIIKIGNKQSIKIFKR